MNLSSTNNFLSQFWRGEFKTRSTLKKDRKEFEENILSINNINTTKKREFSDMARDIHLVLRTKDESVDQKIFDDLVTSKPLPELKDKDAVAGANDSQKNNPQKIKEEHDSISISREREAQLNYKNKLEKLKKEASFELSSPKLT
jgi:hypothetical protein